MYQSIIPEKSKKNIIPYPNEAPNNKRHDIFFQYKTESTKINTSHGKNEYTQTSNVKLMESMISILKDLLGQGDCMMEVDLKYYPRENKMLEEK